MGAAAENATLFLVYNNIRRALVSNAPSSELPKTPFSHILLAAAGGGAATSFVLYVAVYFVPSNFACVQCFIFRTPVELVKCKMQVQMIASSPLHPTAQVSSTPTAMAAHPRVPISSLPGPITILRSVIAAEGVRGLWLGHTGTLIRETGGAVVWFGVKELVSDQLLARRAHLQSAPPPSPLKLLPVISELHDKLPTPPLHLKPWESALSGACAGVTFSFLLFPADCVKSTIQTEEELRPRAKLRSGETPLPKSTFSGVFKEIYRTKGIKGLYAGCGVTVARSAPSSALIFLIYDALERYLG